jgi:hypothetical protein
MALIVWNFVFQNLCIAAAYRPVEELLEEEKVIEFNIFFYDLRSPSIYTGPGHPICLFLLEYLCLADMGKFLPYSWHDNVYCVISLMVKFFRF